MIRLNNNLFSGLTSLIAYEYRTPKKVGTFAGRIKTYSKLLDRYDRQFHMRPPNLESKNKVIFPIKIEMRVRHVFNKKKSTPKFQ